MPGDTGIRWFPALEDAIASFAVAQARCPLAPDNAASPFEVRRLLCGREPHVYRILHQGRYGFYPVHMRLAATEPHVYRILHQGRYGFYPAYPPRTPAECLPAL